MNHSELYSFVEKDGVDGFFIFYTAILNGMDVQRMPGQLFLISNHRTPDSKTSFVHSVAQSTRLSTTTFVLQKRFRRVLFQQAKVKMPKAATFSFFSNIDPIKYANKIGYPVVVKEMFGENPAYGIYNVRNKGELQSAIEKVRCHLPVSSDKSPSSYAQTINLGSAETLENNTRIKSVKSRFVIEKQLSGDLYRAYVINGQVKCMLKFDDAGFSLLTADNHEHEIAQLAKLSIDAIPGIVNAAVDVVKASDGECYLVEFSERLLPFSEIRNQDQLEIFKAIFQYLLESELLLANCNISRKRSKVKYLLSFSGAADIDALKNKLSHRMNKVGVEIKFLNESDVLGKLDVEISGGTAEIALSIESLLQKEHVSHVSLTRKLMFKRQARELGLV